MAILLMHGDITALKYLDKYLVALQAHQSVVNEEEKKRVQKEINDEIKDILAGIRRAKQSSGRDEA